MKLFLLILPLFTLATCSDLWGILHQQNSLDSTEEDVEGLRLLQEIRGHENSEVGRTAFYLASIQLKLPTDKFYHYCTGVILDSMTIATSTKCINQRDRILPKDMRIVAGSNQSLKPSSSEQVRSIHIIYTHPRFNDKNGDYDFSMLVLESPLELNHYVNNIRLPPGDFKGPSGKCVLGGWHTLNYYGLDQDPVEYHEEVLPIMPQEKCASIYWEIGTEITNRMICAGEDNLYYLEDQGSPLVCDGILVGIASKRVWPKHAENWSSYPWVFSSVAEA